MASIDYRSTRTSMVYAPRRARLQIGRLQRPRQHASPSAPSTSRRRSTSYEIGVRSTIADQLRLNVTAFYNDYRNFQARVAGTGLDPVTGLPSPILSVINAGRLNIKGVEVEAAWTPVPGLLLDTQIGYLDAEYDEFADVRFTTGGSRAFQDAGLRAELDAPARRAI